MRQTRKTPPRRPGTKLDVITIGRSSVDLYGQQIGGRLEDMSSFVKAIGGSPANIAAGAARLGLKAGLITRVGDEHMGRFIREQLIREGVDTRGVKTDPKRLTALVLLGVRDDKTFPLIFLRENCADAALDKSDIDPAFIRSAKAVTVTGTHFARANTAAAQKKAIRIAKAAGRKVAFDIDYRPNLWGLAGHGAGESRFIKSANVTKHLQAIVGDCDLIVGTEEELHIAGGSQDTLAALRKLRRLTAAVLVCKRGPMGCVVFPGPIPASLEDGIKGPGFPVDVYNALGAGDAFMAGFLRGWLTDQTFETCAAWANACGAMAVSRLLCAPEYFTWPELQYFLKHGSPHRALRKDRALAAIHWSTTRRPQPETLRILSIDHRLPLIELARKHGVDDTRIADFKRLVVEAAAKTARGRPGFGMFLDGGPGRAALHEAHGRGLWLARPVDKPHARPLDFEGSGSLGAELAEWPVAHTVKCALYAHPDESAAFWEKTDRELIRLNDACRAFGRELLIELLASPHGKLNDDTHARVLQRVYALGIRPDWWMIEAQPSAAAWQAVNAAIEAHDPLCRGILAIARSLENFPAELALARRAARLKGFAAGRLVFGSVIEAWLPGMITGKAAIREMAARFARLTKMFADR